MKSSLSYDADRGILVTEMRHQLYDDGYALDRKLFSHISALALGKLDYWMLLSHIAVLEEFHQGCSARHSVSTLWTAGKTSFMWLEPLEKKVTVSTSL